MPVLQRLWRYYPCQRNGADRSRARYVASKALQRPIWLSRLKLSYDLKGFFSLRTLHECLCEPGCNKKEVAEVAKLLLVHLKSAIASCGRRHFEQALRVDRPPSALSFATSSFLPATQGKHWTKTLRGRFNSKSLLSSVQYQLVHCCYNWVTSFTRRDS
jgi:hypothetical protein